MEAEIIGIDHGNAAIKTRILIKSTASQDGMLYFRGNCCFIPNAQLVDASDAKRIVCSADRYPQEPRNSSRNAASQQKPAGKRPRKGQAR